MEKYKRRLEDMAELRQQVKELDELNSKYLDQVTATIMVVVVVVVVIVIVMMAMVV